MLKSQTGLPKRTTHGHRKKTIALTTMVAPGAIWFLLIRYLPMFGIVLSFKDYRIARPNTFINNLLTSKWVGFDNFKFLFISPDTGVMIRNTIFYNAFWIVLGILISVSLAIMLSEIRKRFLAKTYQTLMFFPYFLSWVVASYFVLAFLDPTSGLLVHFQKGLGQTPMDWYNNPTNWPLILTICNVWKYAGYSAVLYLAAITGIDATQYEAAAVDGASKWQQIRHVTLPNIRSMIIILFIMNVGRIFNADFGLFFSVPQNSGPLRSATMVIDTYIYTSYVNTGNVGMNSAAGFLQNFVGMICIVAANTIVRKLDADSSLF